ncbi:MAG: glycoside hydrolase family 28 protein [Anaerolineaceae bacterium]|nr:MAG: glycoside hydrolase family 28 protein [Anaerolineaceae bacterium]
MKVELLFVSARNAVIEIDDGGIYNTNNTYEIIINEDKTLETNRVITSLYGLMPDRLYNIEVRDLSGDSRMLTFNTDKEFVTLDVKEFGAKGNGVWDDTLPIQAAVMACPKEGRVYIPKGIYKITSLFLKSDLRIELGKDAVLIAETDRYKYPVLPGLIESYDEKVEYNLGTWEGNPLPMFSGIITGLNVSNVLIYGEGTIDGRAGEGDWWEEFRIMRGAFRPRLLFLNNCNNIKVQGIKFMNSPSWTIHPYFSKNLTFIDIDITNPSESPNTDGLNPESCSNVDIIGLRFSLGDDCISLKSGKIYMGRKYKIPCESILIRQCKMDHGHGAVTIGSEMAGGIYNIQVKDCIFRSTDRGLRIKTRRGRGKDAEIDKVVFDNIKMKDVMTPFVINCFYFCDPDGKTTYVQSRDKYPVDERTPNIKSLHFSNIECEDCHVAAAYFYGLPEQKIKQVIMENINVTYADDPKADMPIMACDIEPCSKVGVFATNIEQLTLKNVKINGQDGQPFVLDHIDKIEIL